MATRECDPSPTPRKLEQRSDTSAVLRRPFSRAASSSARAAPSAVCFADLIRSGLLADSTHLRCAARLQSTGTLTKHLQDLDYECLALLDSDEPPSPSAVADAEAAGAAMLLWPGGCSIEERIFLDVPWSTVRDLVAYAASYHTAESILTRINAQCAEAGVAALPNLALPVTLDTPAFRRLLGTTAKSKKRPWFKSIDHGEVIAAIIHPCLSQIPTTPLRVGLQRVRDWIDG